jgi:predicted GNAT family acetyltransferase
LKPSFVSIRHEAEARRFTADVTGGTAFISYRELPNRILDLDHTFVPPDARGGGIASQLTAHALRYAREHGYAVVPSCPFVAAFMRRQPEYRDLIA